METMEKELSVNSNKQTALSEYHYMSWDKEKKHPFMFNKYFANSEQRTLSHANSLYLNYNCTESDLKEVSGRIICNTIDEIKIGFRFTTKHPPKKFHNTMSNVGRVGRI